MSPDWDHSIWLLWTRDADRRFRGYYVNFEEPFRRTAIGFDTNDHTLDIVVAPDSRWSWKDVDDFDARVQQGMYSPEFAAAIRADAAGVIATIESRRPPFPGEWQTWQPDPAWPRPRLPADWQTAAVAAWDRHHWAYPSAR